MIRGIARLLKGGGVALCQSKGTRQMYSPPVVVSLLKKRLTKEGITGTPEPLLAAPLMFQV